MTRLAKALKISDTLRIKTFELGGQIFRVKVPLNSELDSIINKIVNVPEEDVKKRLEKMIAALKDSNLEGVEVKDDDVVVEGRSTKESVVAVMQMERKVVEYLKLLVPETGTLDDLTYEEIEQEFPLQVQLELLEKITEVIQPGYKDARKN